MVPRRRQSTDHRQPSGITSISIRGYKSLAEECSVEIRPLTLLAGANSSGKSSALQPLLLLKQTLEASYDPGAVLLNGPNVQFTSAEQLLSRVTPKRRTNNFTVRVEVNGNLSVAQTFRKPPKSKSKSEAFRIAQAIYSEPDGDVTRITPDMDPPSLASLLPESLKDALDRVYGNNGSSVHPRVHRDRCFLSLGVSVSDDDRGTDTFVSIITLTPEAELEPFIRGIIHVPGLRGNPERTYKTTAIGTEFPGTFDDYIASIINHWQAAGDKRLDALRDGLETLGLTGRVEARQVDDVQVELRVGRLIHGPKSTNQDMVNITDVGFGVSQTLPVLVALLAARPGQLVYLEQPELHLHPRAQVALARVLADAANRGVRVVAETHSSLLLLAIQTLVAENDLLPSDVKLHWFTRRADGVTDINSADLDEAGTFGEWPEDFADVALDAERRYLNAIESRQ